MATYTKLRSGEWGIRMEGAAKPGMTVAVKTKAGKVKSETIAKVVWSGNGISICAISQRPAEASSHSSTKSEYCGYECPVTGMRCCAKNGPCHDCL